MKKVTSMLLIGTVALGVMLCGCGQKKTASSAEAINIAKGMKTVEEKASYLISQAKSFYNSKDFQQTIDIAQHILSYVDKDSQEAKDLLQKAKAQLQAMAEKAAGDVKEKLGNLIK